MNKICNQCGYKTEIAKLNTGKDKSCTICGAINNNQAIKKTRRAIVKSAKNVSELYNQFIDIDNMTWKQVDEFYADTYIIQEAEYLLGVVVEEIKNWESDEPDYAIFRKDIMQLKRFIKTWKPKCKPHKNDGIAWEDLEIMIKGVN